MMGLWVELLFLLLLVYLLVVWLRFRKEFEQKRVENDVKLEEFIKAKDDLVNYVEGVIADESNYKKKFPKRQYIKCDECKEGESLPVKELKF